MKRHWIFVSYVSTRIHPHTHKCSWRNDSFFHRKAENNMNMINKLKKKLILLISAKASFILIWNHLESNIPECWIQYIEKFLEMKMNSIHLLVLGLLSHVHCQIMQNTFTRDRNTDLTDAFKANGLLVLGTSSDQADCYASCLAMCNSNASCMAMTFSNVDQTCTFYNRSFCYGNETVFTSFIDLYGKKLPNGLFSAELFLKAKCLKPISR